MKVLQFSGGIDSLATLFVMRGEWNDITVLWGNAGVPYPETLLFMGRIRQLVPHFMEVKADKSSWERIFGIAVDVIPERHTHTGELFYGKTDRRYTSSFHCCAANLWKPVEDATKALRPTHIIRGQKRSDVVKSPIRNGHIDADGVVYEFPIELWTKEEVWEYCNEVAPDYIPQYYRQRETSSHDCWNCIAYLDENVQRIRNLKTPYREVVIERLAAYKEDLSKNAGNLSALLGEKSCRD